MTVTVETLDDLRKAPRGHDPEAPHLFPGMAFGDWEMSVQADRNGYACAPAERLDSLGGYDRVEVGLRGPDGHLAHASALGGLPDALVAAFGPEGEDEVPVGAFLAWEDVALLVSRLEDLAAEPSRGP